MKRLLMLILVTLAVACADATNITTAPDDESTTAQEAEIGDALNLSGLEPELEMAVTVERVIDPAKPKDQFSKPQEGYRLVAVDLRLENIGSANYSDSPGNGAALIDADGHQYNETFLASEDCNYIGSSVRIAPRDFRAGCLLFEVPDSADVAQFQFTLESGFANETGQWKL